MLGFISTPVLGEAMIWDSVPLMTAVDLLIMGVVAYGIWRCRSISFENRLKRPRIALLLINLGLLLLGLFYTADLAIMHVLPMVTSMDKASEVMMTLHRELSWLVNLLAVVFISVGFIELLTELQRQETKRKRAEAEAHESERRYHEAMMELAHANRITEMGQLTASIAHEVKQPIATTVTLAQAGLRFLNAQSVNSNGLRDVLTDIVKSGKRAAEIIHRIHDLIKRAPPRMERLGVNEAIGEVIELTRGEVNKHCISVQTHFAEGLPTVEADRIQLQQVILNLMVNAVQAMSQNGQDSRELFVSTSMDGSNALLVSVRDSGPGISPENVGRLFDPFFTTKLGSTGMGLSICRSIVEAQGGRLWATPNLPRGAAFHFTLPVDVKTVPKLRA
jgi:C4-dicarboxylate-specific signal transduction histidine kinase